MGNAIRYFVEGREELLYMAGDRVETRFEYGEADDLGDYPSKAEALEAARIYIDEHPPVAHPSKHGIGSVTYFTAEVLLCSWDDEEGGYSPCDEAGNATYEYTCAEFMSNLTNSREYKAFEAAKNDYWAFLDYEQDYYSTIDEYL